MSDAFAALAAACGLTVYPMPRAEATPDPARGVDLSPVRRSGARRLRVLCACGHWIDWRAAEYVGAMADEVASLELRNCPRCGSTRAMATTEDER